MCPPIKSELHSAIQIWVHYYDPYGITDICDWNGIFKNSSYYFSNYNIRGILRLYSLYTFLMKFVITP